MASATSSNSNAPSSAEQFFQFSLLGLLASGYLAVVGSGYVDLVTSVATGVAIVVRAFLVAAGRQFPLSDRWITALTVAYIGFYPLDVFFVSQEFLPSTVHLVLFLAVVKILTARSGRDHLFVVVIGFLEILAASLLSSNLSFFIFLALFLLFAVSTLASWEIRKASGGGRTVLARNARLSWRLAFLASIITFGVLLITIGLFFLLPRTARAAFSHLVPEKFHITAFSDEVTLGEIGTIKQQGTVLMHVRIPTVEGLMHLKWRGNALDRFDGRRWSSTSIIGEPLRVQQNLLQLADDNQRRRKGTRLDYEVQLKSFASDLLFIAGLPEFIRINEPYVIRTPADGFRVSYRKPGVLRYGVFSYLDVVGLPVPFPVNQLDPDLKQRHLDVPDLDPRIADLARRLTANTSGAYRQARAIADYLPAAYAYTLELPEEEEDDPIAQFLFERRRGHCEYFASAMAVMLRTIGIPSRIATGFQSGIYNPISGWHVIRASDAHSWVEAWLPGYGWTTFDPTPPDPSQTAPSLFTRLNLFFDAADTFWQEWVLEYDLNRQLFLASRMERSSRRFSFGWLDGFSARWHSLKDGTVGLFDRHGGTAGITLAALAVLLLLAAPLRRWWIAREQALRVEQGSAGADDATVLYLRALEMLERAGFKKPAWLTPGEFARQIPAPATATAMGDLTRAYNELRFGARPDAAPLIVQCLHELEESLKSESGSTKSLYIM
jgi:protein-glutamine gamma-glutamyltransferase